MIIAAKGTKGKFVPAERRQRVTLCCAVGALENSLPSVFFHRVNFKDHFIISAPMGSIGWMTIANFCLFMAHFAKHTRAGFIGSFIV